ncbi:MAG TPA: signal peptidase I [Acidimicrobiales bacterium]
MSTSIETSVRRPGLRTAGRVLRYAVQVGVTAVALAAGAVLVVPKALGWHGVLVLTGSMEPALQTGGVAFVDRVEPEAIEVGDIMTFTRPNSTQQVTHRVTGVIPTSTGYRFTTKGDANDIPDNWIVREEQVVGKVRFALPHMAGAVQLLVGNRLLLALLMAVPAAYLIYDDVKRSRAKRRAKRAPVPAPVAAAAPAAAPLAVPAPAAAAPRPTPVAAAMAAPPRPRRTRAGATPQPATRRPRPLRAEPLPAEPTGPSSRAHRVAAGMAVALPVVVTMATAYEATRPSGKKRR